MSEAKRQELTEAGRLRADGSRIELCPMCGHEVTDEQYAAITGSGVAVAESVVATNGETGT